MRKMIAFQKMLVTMLFPTCFGNGNEKKIPADGNLLLIYSIAVYFVLIRFSTTASALGFTIMLFLFLYRVLVRNTFIFHLPEKRSFTISGIYIFDSLFVLTFMLFFIAPIFLLGLPFFVFSGSFLLFEDWEFIQEQIVIFSLSLLYINLLTPTLLLKRKSSRIIGMTAVSVLYSLFIIILGNQIGKNLWSSNFLSHYLQYAPDGWLFVGACLLGTIILSIASILVAEFIEWYGRKHTKFEESTAQ